MSYCIAFSVDGGAVDVSRAYIPEDHWEGEKGEDIRKMRLKCGSEEAAGEGSKLARIISKVSRTNLFVENQALRVIRNRRRQDLPSGELKRLEVEDERDRTWFHLESTPSPQNVGNVVSLSLTEPTEEDAEPLEGRKSGTEAWKRARGETGK